jgi:hypothetical protein
LHLSRSKSEFWFSSLFGTFCPTVLAQEFMYSFASSTVSIAFLLFMSDDTSLPKGYMLLELDELLNGKYSLCLVRSLVASSSIRT